MKLNIITGLLFALILLAGVNTKATAQSWRWHNYHNRCSAHMNCKDKDNDKKDMDVKDKDSKAKDCSHSCSYKYWGCHSWAYVAPKHCTHDNTCHQECSHHHCDDYRDNRYYYRGGGR